MPADCTAIAPEAIQMGEPPQPAPGWAALVASSLSGSPDLIAMRQELRDAFDAYTITLKAQDVPPPYDPSEELEQAHEGATQRHLAAVQAWQNFRPTSITELAAKADALKSAEADLCDGLARPALHVLVDDIVRVIRADTACPAARLLDEHEGIEAAESEENETGALGRAHKRAQEIEEQASWARAKTLRGAMYQTSLAIHRADLMNGEDDELQSELDKQYIDRTLSSVLSVLHSHVGGSVPQVVNSYSGMHYRYVEHLSDDPQPFDARDFVKRYTAAGGRLAMGYDEEGNDALTNSYPRDPSVRAEFIKELSNPTMHEAVFQLMKAERHARVNAENPSAKREAVG